MLADKRCNLCVHTISSVKNRLETWVHRCQVAENACRHGIIHQIWVEDRWHLTVITNEHNATSTKCADGGTDGKRYLSCLVNENDSWRKAALTQAQIDDGSVECHTYYRSIFMQSSSLGSCL